MTVLGIAKPCPPGPHRQGALRIGEPCLHLHLTEGRSSIRSEGSTPVGQAGQPLNSAELAGPTWTSQHKNLSLFPWLLFNCMYLLRTLEKIVRLSA